MPFKPVGVDEEGNFPPRVEQAQELKRVPKHSPNFTGTPTLEGIPLSTDFFLFVPANGPVPPRPHSDMSKPGVWLCESPTLLPEEVATGTGGAGPRDLVVVGAAQTPGAIEAPMVSTLSATLQPDGSISASWTAPPSTSGLTVIGYIPYRSDPDWVPTAPITATSFSFANFPKGKMYTIGVEVQYSKTDGSILHSPRRTVSVNVPFTETPTNNLNPAFPMRAPIPKYGERLRSYYNLVWNNPPTSRAWSITPPNANEVRIAFLQGNPLRIASNQWGVEQNPQAYGAALQNLRSNRGIRVVASIGGENGAVNLSDRNGCVNGILDFVNQVGMIDGIDFDLEGSAVVDGKDSDGKYHAVYIAEQLKAALGPYFYVTFAPPGGTPVSKYRPVAKAMLNAGFDIIWGQQYYDNTSITDSATRSAFAATVNDPVNGIPAQYQVLGMQSPTTGALADAAYTTPSQAVTRLNYVKAQYPDVAGYYHWVMNASDLNQWDSVVGGLVKGWE